MSSYPPLAFDLVCLDLDGTLVDSARDIQNALAAAFASVPTDDPDARREQERFVAHAGLGHSLQEIFAHARPGRDQERERFVETYIRYYAEHGLTHSRLFAGVEATLEELQALRAHGLRLAIATTKRTETATRVCRGLGLDRFLDVIVGSETLPPKPAPDVLLHAAKRTGVLPSRGVMIGDMPGDILAGKAAGMRTAAVTTGVLPRADLVRHQPDWVLEQFTDLTAIVRG